MNIADWLPILAVIFGGGGFWIWVRKLSADVAVLNAWARQIDKRCEIHRQDNITSGDKIGEVHERVDALVRCIADKDSETAKAVGRLEGKMDSLLGGDGKVRT